MSFTLTFQIIISIQILVTTLIFAFYKSKKPRQNRYLAYFFFTLFIESLIPIVYEQIKHPAVYFHPFQLNFLSIIFLYFYARDVANIEIKNRIKYFVLAIIEFIVFSYIFIKLIYDSQFYSSLIESSFLRFERLFMFSFIIFFCVKIILVNRSHRTRLPYSFSSTGNKSLNWLSIFCYIIIFFVLIRMVDVFFIPNTKILPAIHKHFFIISLYYFTIASLIQINIENKVLSQSQLRLLNEKNLLAEKEFKLLTELFFKIEADMEKNNSYLDSTLNLNSFSKKMNIPKREISKAINLVGHKNFNQYINSYRIEAFKNAVADNAHKTYSIDAIAKDIGFSSKASFYKNFKENMSLSPSEYINNLTIGD